MGPPQFQGVRGTSRNDVQSYGNNAGGGSDPRAGAKRKKKSENVFVAL